MNILKISVLAFLFMAASSQCFALRDIAVLTKKEAKELGIEVRAKPAGPDAVWLELEFKPEGKLKEFTHVELKMTEGEKSFVFSAALRETRSSSGSVVVTFTAIRAYLEKTALSVVMRGPREAGDHTYELRMKDFVDLESLDAPRIKADRPLTPEELRVVGIARRAVATNDTWVDQKAHENAATNMQFTTRSGRAPSPGGEGWGEGRPTCTLVFHREATFQIHFSFTGFTPHSSWSNSNISGSCCFNSARTKGK